MSKSNVRLSPYFTKIKNDTVANIKMIINTYVNNGKKPINNIVNKKITPADIMYFKLLPPKYKKFRRILY